MGTRTEIFYGSLLSIDKWWKIMILMLFLKKRIFLAVDLGPFNWQKFSNLYVVRQFCRTPSKEAIKINSMQPNQSQLPRWSRNMWTARQTFKKNYDWSNLVQQWSNMYVDFLYIVQNYRVGKTKLNIFLSLITLYIYILAFGMRRKPRITKMQCY